MSNERKEGILIAVFVLFVILVMAWWAAWPSGMVYFWWSETPRYSGDIGEYLFQFEFQFTTGLIILLPFFIYGLLRAFGVVRRLFEFERILSNLLPNE